MDKEKGFYEGKGTKEGRRKGLRGGPVNKAKKKTGAVFYFIFAASSVRDNKKAPTKVVLP